MRRLKGKVAVVTGAADGIGKAISEAMAAEGASVFLGDIQDEKGDGVTANICKTGAKAEYRHCDVSSPEDVQALVGAAINECGKIDVMVNNAAIAIGGMPLHEMTIEQWDKLTSVNLSSVFYSCKAVLPHMIKANQGVIINMASAQGHIGLDGWTAYSGCKGAVMSMTRQMAVEFGKNNIRVNSISPGTIETAMNRQVIDELGKHLAESWIKMHPIGRIGKPEEVAEAAVYLASDLAGFTTGIDLKVDGGLTGAPRFVPEYFKTDDV